MWEYIVFGGIGRGEEKQGGGGRGRQEGCFRGLNFMVQMLCQACMVVSAVIHAGRAPLMVSLSPIQDPDLNPNPNGGQDVHLAETLIPNRDSD